MIVRRKIVKPALVICIVCAALLSVHIFRVIATNKTPEISEEVIDKVASIPWDDDSYLESIGFICDGDTWKYFIEDMNGCEEDGTTHTYVFVEDASKPDMKELKMKKYKDIYAGNRIMYGYNNDLCYFFRIPEYAEEYYRFYVNGKRIWVEDGYWINKGGYFEKAILSLK